MATKKPSSNEYVKTRIRELTTKQEEEMTAVLNDDPDAFVPLVFPHVQKGYRINRQGVILGKQGNPMATQQAGNGRYMWNSVARVDGLNPTMQRVDKLVLSTFVGYKPDADVVHHDGNFDNNDLDNLAWAEATEEPEVVEAPVKLASRRAKKARAVKARSTPRGGDEVEVFRVYKYKGLVVSVDAKGTAKLPKVNMTAENLAALAKITTKINEMNHLMGLDK